MSNEDHLGVVDSAGHSSTLVVVVRDDLDWERIANWLKERSIQPDSECNTRSEGTGTDR